MFARTTCLLFVAVLAVDAALACSARTWDANDLVENDVVTSANGRFLAVVRWHEGVPDFGSKRAGEVFRFDEPEPLTIALYESVPWGRVPIAEVPINPDMGRVLLSDSGRFIVALRPLNSGPCGDRTDADDPLVTVYTAEGTRVGSVKVSDVFDSTTPITDKAALIAIY